MKKIFTLIFFSFISLTLFGQTQRLVLIEHFTQASCGPCAVQNPPMQRIIDANSSKVVAIRHQTSWPGTDPMNDHNPTQVQSRVTYYGVRAVPNSVMDGAGPGSPASVVTTAAINARYRTPSPFSIEMTASNSPTLSHANVHVKITAAQDFDGATNAKVAIVEKHIGFDRAPGSNGETDFYDVMKTILPSTTGESLPSTFKKGQVYEFDVEWEFENVYDITQLAVVAYIQQNSSKKIHQAAYLPPFIEPVKGDDATIKWISIDNDIEDNEICGNTAKPNLRLVNTGNTTLTSASIQYSINGGSQQTFDWTGDLEFLEETTIELPEIDFTHVGNNAIYANITTCNGNADASELNSKLNSPFNYAPSVNNEINISFTNMRRAERMTWQIFDGSGNLFAESGPLSGRTSETDVTLPEDDCYELVIDNQHNGTNGKVKVKNLGGDESTILYYRSYPAQTKVSKDITTSAPVGTQNEIISIDEMVISPNPTNGEFSLDLLMNKSVDVDIAVTSILGNNILQKSIHLSTGKNQIPFDLKKLQNGIYLLQLTIDNQKVTKKILLSK